MTDKDLVLLARTAATSETHWTRFFEALKSTVDVDRICVAVRLDAYTAYLPRVAQVDGFVPFVGAAGLYADRERSCTFDVIDGGLPFLAKDTDWVNHPDLAFYSVVAKSNMKFPISMGGAPAVLNIWSATAGAYSADDIDSLAPVAAEISRSPFQMELAPVGLALRKAKALMESRQKQAA
ncbi:MAG: hypothetical protein AAGE90_05480 [Pseudomonadota bacterium]